MKTLNEYLAMPYKMEIVEDSEESGFVVSYPDLPGCITCGETVEAAVENALDAKKAWLQAALEDGIEIHEPDSLEEYSGQFKLRMPRSLHRALAEHSRQEGISMNQYCVYLLAKNDALHAKQRQAPGELVHLLFRAAERYSKKGIAAPFGCGRLPDSGKA